MTTSRLAIAAVIVAACMCLEQASGVLLPRNLAYQDLPAMTSPEAAKRGVDSCSCCANKHLFFCCGACMRQRGADLDLQRSLDPTPHQAALRSLRTSVCACCRHGDDPVTKCCQRCLALENLSL